MSRSVLIAPAALVAGPIAALVASAPAAARVADEHITFPAAWLAIAGLVGLPLSGLIAAMRLARRSLGEMAPDAAPLLWGGTAWLLLSIPVDAMLGAILKATTHHRGLGGTTFAVLAVAANAVLALAAWRLTANALPRVPARLRRQDVALGVALAASVVLFVLIVSGALTTEGPRAGNLADRVEAILVDGTFAVVVTALAALWDVPPSRAQSASWGGGGALVALVTLSLMALLHSPTLLRKVAEQAPFAAAIGQTVGLPGNPAGTSPRPP